MPRMMQKLVMPDLIRHPCVNRHGPRVKPGVTEKVVKPGVTEKVVKLLVTGSLVKPEVTKRNVLVNGHGAHIRATPKLVARG